MKILQYCQHVLGAGHFFRSLEIARALKEHEVILVTGGAQIDVTLPEHVREVRLPTLMMDADFKKMLTDASQDGSANLDEIRTDRKQRLYQLFEAEQPDLFLIELYPFGRKAFRFELDPVLSGIQAGTLPSATVVCSLRDILVEKEDAAAYERRVLRTLKAYFDAVLVHSDPNVLKIDETFGRTAQISVPIVYTGFVTPHPSADDGRRLREVQAIDPDTLLIIASIGGGKVGEELLQAAVQAVRSLDMGQKIYLKVFCGPFMAASAFEALCEFRSHRVTIERFSSEFPAYLAAADLSISMAGYNTCMNIIAAGVPALVWPFGQNREQRLRAEQLARRAPIGVLDDADLTPQRLGMLIRQQLKKGKSSFASVDLEGAMNTAHWIRTWKGK